MEIIYPRYITYIVGDLTVTRVFKFIFLFLLQINFFKDHTKIIVCPLMGAATYIDENKKFRTFPLKNIEKHGCCRSLASRLNYARKMIDQIQETEKKGKKEWTACESSPSTHLVAIADGNITFLLFLNSQLALWVKFYLWNDGFWILSIVKVFICGVIIGTVFSTENSTFCFKIQFLNSAQIFQAFHVSR